MLDIARSATHCDEPLFKEGIPLLQELGIPPKLVTRWCGGREVDDPTFTGEVFGDGSVAGG